MSALDKPLFQFPRAQLETLAVLNSMPWTPFPLHEACKNYDLEEILASGNDPNGQDEKGQTPLHVLLSDGFKGFLNQTKLLDCMKALVKKGCDVNLRDNDGETPLSLSVYNKLELCTRFLVQEGACTTVRSEKFSDLHNLAFYIAKTMPDVMMEILDDGVWLTDDHIYLDWSRVLQYSEKSDLKKYCRQHNREWETTFLFSLLESDISIENRLKYLTHPLISAFMHAKMKVFNSSIRLWILRLSLGLLPICYLIFVYFMYLRDCSVTSSSKMENDQDQQSLNSSMSMIMDGDNMTISADEEDSNVQIADRCDNNIPMLLRVYSWILLAFVLTYEATELSLLVRPEVFRSSKWNWRTYAKFITVILMVVSLLPGIFGKIDYLTGGESTWLYPYAALSTFFAWVMIMMLAESIPMFKEYYEMLVVVLVDVLKITLAFMPLLIGFYMGFNVIFVDAESNFILNFVSMTVDPGSNAHENMIDDAKRNDSMWFRGMTWVFFCGFTIVIGIVFINFLLAKSISDIEKLKERAKDTGLSNIVHNQYMVDAIPWLVYEVVKGKDVKDKIFIWSYHSKVFEVNFSEEIHREIMLLLKRNEESGRDKRRRLQSKVRPNLDAFSSDRMEEVVIQS